MDSNDFVERGFADETKLCRSARVYALGPAANDPVDQRVGLALDEFDGALAGDSAQRRNLFLDGNAGAGH